MFEFTFVAIVAILPLSLAGGGAWLIYIAIAGRADDKLPDFVRVLTEQTLGHQAMVAQRLMLLMVGSSLLLVGLAAIVFLISIFVRWS